MKRLILGLAFAAAVAVGASNAQFVSHVTSLVRGQIPATTTNDNAAAGNVGQYVEATLEFGSATALTTATDKTITSIELTAGDWDITGTIFFLPAATTSYTVFLSSLSLVNNTRDQTLGRYARSTVPASVSGNAETSQSIPRLRLSLAGTTTVYLVARSVFTVDTLTAYGIISARRVR